MIHELLWRSGNILISSTAIRLFRLVTRTCTFREGTPTHRVRKETYPYHLTGALHYIVSAVELSLNNQQGARLFLDRDVLDSSRMT
jgi:hypothetical protein